MEQKLARLHCCCGAGSIAAGRERCAPKVVLVGVPKDGAAPPPVPEDKIPSTVNKEGALQE